MTKRDYELFASLFHACYNGDNWPTIYDEIYTPLVVYLQADNPRFDPLKFSWAVATGDFKLKDFDPETAEVFVEL